MKTVNFIKQGMKNFCNHIDPVEIEFGNGKLLMITGPNGSGKTSIFQAIPFTLYGVCEKGRGDDVVNNKVGKNCHTWTEFSIDDDFYRVDRYVSYTKLGNTVTLKKNKNKTPYKKGHKEVVPEIERLLVPKKLFDNTLLFSQKVKTFFTDLTDSEQKEIFRKILGLDEYVLYMKQCGIDLKTIEEDVLKMNTEIAVIHGLIENNEQRIVDQQKLKNNYYINRKEAVLLLKGEIKKIYTQKDWREVTLKEYANLKIDERLETVNNAIGSLNEKLSTIDNDYSTKLVTTEAHKDSKISDLKNSASEAKQEIQTRIKERTDEISKISKESSKKFSTAIEKINKEVSEINVRVQEIDTSIKFKNETINELTIGEITECPTCHQEIGPDCVQHLEDKKSEIVKELLEFGKEREQLSIILDGLQNNKELIEKESKEIEDEFNDQYQLLNDKLQEETTSVQERLTIATNKVLSLFERAKIQFSEEKESKKSSLEDDISKLEEDKAEIENLVAEKNTIQNDLNDIKNDLASKESSLRETEEREFDDTVLNESISKRSEYEEREASVISEREKYIEDVKMLEFWKKGFSASGIQSMLIDESIPFMNRTISDYMDLLCDGRYSVTFDTLKPTKDEKEFRDKIYVDVFDTQTHADKRVKFSGGQTRLVDIGTILTLSDLQSMIQDVKFNIILFDEVFDSLDVANIRYVSHLLRIISKKMWIGIISHRHIEEIEADETLTFGYEEIEEA